MPPEGRHLIRTRSARGTVQPLFLCAAKKKPLAVKRKRQRGICVGTNFTSLVPPQAAGLVRFVVPPFPARTASLDSRGSPFFGIPLKRPRRGLMPPSWINPRGWFVQSAFQATKKRGADAYWTDQRGSRNTLRLSRLPYVKYSTGANVTTRTLYRALRKPDSTVARRAFLDRQCNEKTYNGTNCLSARKRYFASCASFLHTFFWQDRKKYARGATVAVAQ